MRHRRRSRHDPSAARLVRLPKTTDPTWRRFELKEKLPAAHNVALAYRQAYTGSAWTSVDDEDFSVADELGILCGRARGTYTEWPNAGVPYDGSLGWAQLDPESGLWIIRSLQPHATMVVGQVDVIGAVAGVRTVTLEAHYIIQPAGGIAIDHDPYPFTAMTAYDPYFLETVAGRQCVAVWNSGTSLPGYNNGGVWTVLHVEPYSGS